MRPNHRAGALPVYVKVADVKSFTGLLDLVAIPGVYSPRQSVLSGVREFERLIEILRFRDRQHGPKDFFLKNAGARRDIGNDGRLDEVAVAFNRSAATHQPAFGPAYLDVVENRTLRAFIDHRAHVAAGIVRRPHHDLRHALLQLFEKLVVNRLIHDRARAGRAFLPLIAVGGNDHAFHGALQIRLAIDNDRVLSAHLGDDALDPDLALLGLRRELIDAQADVARTGERYEPRLGMLDQRVAHRRSAARAQRKTLLRKTCFEEHLHELGGNSRRIARRFQHYRIARHQGRGGHARQDGEWKIPRRDNHAGAERHVN